MHVVVVGAGIAGLVTAIGFHRAGVEVTVLEQAEHIEAVGAGISLFRNGLAGFTALGLEQPVRALGGGPAPGMRSGVRDPSGRWLVTVPATAADLQVVHRADLQALLLTALPEGLVRTGVSVASVRRAGARCVALAADGSALAEGDLLVGADGIRSVVRSAVAGESGLHAAGWAAWRGVTGAPLVVDALAETWGRGQLFGITLLGDGRVYWFAGARTSGSAALPDARAELVRRFGGWHAPISDVIAATPAQAVLRHDIITLARPLRRFVAGRVVLVGDAAHPMTPNLGQGGNQAIEDAVTLVRLVCGRAPDLGAALACYDQLRRRRTASLVRRSALLGRVALARFPPVVAVRNVVLRMTPGQVVARTAATAGVWQPPSVGGDGAAASARVRCVGAIVFDRAGRLLLVQRGHAPAAGLWSIPGGRVEPGETDSQAVTREVTEETGLVVQAGALAGMVERPGPDGAVYEIYDYDAVVIGDGRPAAASDAADLRWVTRRELGTLPVTDGLVQALHGWGRLD